MSDRYCFMDIDFFHKRTCEKLHDEFGWAGPAAWLSLIAEAKRSRIPGTIVVTSEPDFWKQLGMYERESGFTMDAFLTVTGRLKQTSRRRVGRLLHVVLTNYGRWQKDAWRQREAERKASKRGKSTPDTTRTSNGHDPDTGGDRELELDIPPLTPPGGDDHQVEQKTNSAKTGERAERRHNGKRITGCRLARGTHGQTFVRDPLGTDKPPPDWPHEPPSLEEIRKARGVRA